MVKLSIGNTVENSMSRHKTTDPKWENNFHFLINNPQHQELNLEVSRSSWNKNKAFDFIRCKCTLNGIKLINDRSTWNCLPSCEEKYFARELSFQAALRQTSSSKKKQPFSYDSDVILALE